MSVAFDPRVVEVEIVLPTGETYTFANQNPSLAIYASGSKFCSANQNTCECRIFNLTRELRNAILTLASPLLAPPANSPVAAANPRPPVILNLKVGRVSTGTFLLFTGNVIACEMTQPPDIGIVLRSLTNNYNTAIIENIQFPAITNLSGIAGAIAQKNGLFLDFEATDKQIGNYSYAGSLQQNVQKLNEMGGVQAGVDNQTLYVINASSARKNTGFTISESTGMVGIPQVTAQGVTVRVMINSAIQIGGAVTIQSVMNPAANGTFKVAKIDYEIASRDQPFWYVLLCSNQGIFQGEQ
jgi:hypothetical protein